MNPYFGCLEVQVQITSFDVWHAPLPDITHSNISKEFETSQTLIHLTTLVLVGHLQKTIRPTRRKNNNATHHGPFNG